MAGLPMIPSPEVLARLADLLRAQEYSEARVAAALDLPDLGQFFEQAFSLYRYSLNRTEPRLAALIRLFLLNEPLPAPEGLAVLGRELASGLVRGGVLAVAEEGFLRSRYLLSPIDGAFIFTDRRVKGDRNRVMPLGHDTYNLVSQTLHRPGGTVLDLGTGSGVQGVLAARWASRVVSVDINPRALDFCRMNAHLNGVFDKMELHLGSLYEPVQGQRFDVILANPPFVPNAEYEVLFRDGGVQGEDILHLILRDAPRHLEETGVLQIMTEIIYHDARGPAAKVREWSGDRLCGVIFEQDEDYLKLYAEEHVLRTVDEDSTHASLSRRIAEYQAFLDSVGIWKITHATLHLLPDAPPPDVDPAWRQPVATAEVTDLRTVGAERVARALVNVARVIEPDALERVADHRVAFDPGLRVVASWRPGSDEPQPVRVEFVDGAPWHPGDLEPQAVELLRLLAEAETVGDWVGQALAGLELPEEDARALLHQVLQSLVQYRWISLVPPVG